MKISTRERGDKWAELIIESDSFRMMEDIDIHESDSAVEQLVSAAREINIIANKKDIDFVWKVVEAFLNDTEREELIERMKGSKI